MTLEFEIEKLSERARALLLLKANQWQCSPSEALARLLDSAAQRVKLPPTPNNKDAA